MKRYIKQLNIGLMTLGMFFLFSQCEKDHLLVNNGESFVCGTVKDYDGNEYKTVRIGHQEWMARNLRAEHYADGTAIPSSSRHCPDNDEDKVKTYGYLYDWYAVMRNSSSSWSNPSGVQGICPDGWHVPSDAEWDELESYVKKNGDEVMSGSVAKALAAQTGWWGDGHIGYQSETNNSTGFSALPAGYYNGWYNDFGDYADFWSATQGADDNALCRYLDYNGPSVYCCNYNKSLGLSVRCVKD